MLVCASEELQDAQSVSPMGDGPFKCEGILCGGQFDRA